VSVVRATLSVLMLAMVVWLAQVSPVCARTSTHPPSFASSPSVKRLASSTDSERSTPTQARAPSGPPLSVSGSQGEEASASSPASGGDTLVENGLGSPLCRSPQDLSAAEQRSCQTADFVAASEPTNNYAFDVNINTGVGKWGNDISATVENFAQFGWMALVSAAHGLVVMFEWCYSLNLLSDSLLREVAGALHDARVTFTEPWMVIALTVASMLAVYHGLIRRRVTETVGGVLAMLAMMVGGLWVIVDPAGTVGAIEQWANQAGLGTLAAVASGSPRHPERTLAESMQTLFGSVVSAPWCYMEFGDVRWCESGAQLDGGLRKAALAIAGNEERKSGCRGLCDSGSSPGDRTLAASAALLREAQTNGALFLALPANEVERNSVKKKGTLLNVLCGGGESTDKCRGPMAPQAEFRSENATGSRVLGLFLIWSGALGMLLLLGFLVLRLLSAALMGLFFLLLAPAAVLTPALGDAGRAAFRGWALRLLEAVVAKLTYSFLLGVVLMMMKLLLGLTVLGWWTQWLLISAFWWSAFLKRDRVFGFSSGGAGRSAARPRSIPRRVGEALEAPRSLLHRGHTIKDKFARPAPEVKQRPPHDSSRHANTSMAWGDQSSVNRLSRSGASQGDGESEDHDRGGSGDGGQAEMHSGYVVGERLREQGWATAEEGDSGQHWSRRQPEGASGRNSGGGDRGASSKRVRALGSEVARRQRFDRGDQGVGEPQGSFSAGVFSGQRFDRDRHENRIGVRTAVSALNPGAGLRQGSAVGEREQLKRVRHERQKALDNGDTRRAATLGAREQRVEAKLAKRQMPALEGVDPELAVGELMADAIATRHIGVNGVHGSEMGSENSPGPPGVDALETAKQRSRVMDDAREVAAGRKRQLGWDVER
jgi:hypothetical protein